MLNVAAGNLGELADELVEGFNPPADVPTTMMLRPLARVALLHFGISRQGCLGVPALNVRPEEPGSAAPCPP